MSTQALGIAPRAERPTQLLQHAGTLVLRYGLVLILVYFGSFKFTDVEARAIQPLLEHSPLLHWMYSVTDVRGASRFIGLAELAIAALIVLRPWAPLLSAVGSLLAVGMFFTTLSFLVTTPGLWLRVEGFPAPSEAAAFILKDVFLLGAALWTAAEALGASGRLPTNAPH